MTTVTKYKRGIAAFISSEKGQRFFNFAYSIGAAIVIWGALFKILHLPGGNALLSIGMGTEVLMFVLTAFDRPPKEYKWETVFPVLDTKNPEDAPDFKGGEGGGVIIAGGNGGDGGAVVIAGSANAGGNAMPIEGHVAPQPITAPTVTQESCVADTVASTQQYLDQMALLATEMQHLRETTAALNGVSDTLLQSYEAITQNSAEISDSSSGYVEQMKSLNRNIDGLNTIYEIQLKSISSQLDAIDRVNRGIKDIRDMFEKSAAQSVKYCEETEKMARYMQQLNQVYEKMITAMTINMYNPMMAGQAPGTPEPVRQPEEA
ncbi:MAG: gliding motility protein GldL [Bacteroidales bacterium]|nr:gliding motility protein GldL [Bacteroidales bacterium]